MTMPGDYSEELLVVPEERIYLAAARAKFAAHGYSGDAAEWRATAQADMTPFRAAVDEAFDAGQRAILDALSSSGRLVPEDSEVREEWGNVAPSGDSVPAASRKRAEEWKRRLDAPILRRTAIYGPWTPSEPEEKPDA